MENVNFLQKILNNIGFGRKSESEPFGYGLVETYSTELFQVENIESFYKVKTKISSIPKSISEITKSILSHDWKIVEIKSQEKIKKDNLPEDLINLIEQPHPHYNFMEFVSLINDDLHIAGNVWCLRIKAEKSNNKNKVALLRLHPKDIQYQSGEWYYNDPSGRMYLLDQQFLTHIKLVPDTYDPIWGRGIIAEHLATIIAALRLIEFRENFYKKGCFPGGVFSVENAGAFDQKRIEAKLTDNKQGSRNAGTPIVLIGKTTYHQTQLDPTALKVSDELEKLNKEIMSAFGLPRYLMELGLRDGGQKYNNHALQQEHFIKSTVIPIAKKIERVFNGFVKLYNPNWEFKFNIHAEIYDPKDLINMVREAAITRNEYRELMSLPKSDNKNLEKYLIAGQVQTIEDAVEGLSNNNNNNPPNISNNSPQQPKVPVESPTNPPLPKPKKKIDNAAERSISWRDDHYLSEPEDEVWTLDELKKEKNKKRIRQDFINLNTKTRHKKAKENLDKYKYYLVETYGNIIVNIAKNASQINQMSGNKNEKKDLSKFIESVFDENEALLRFQKISVPLYQSVGAATFSNTSGILTTATPFNISDPGVAEKINLLRKDGPLVMKSTKGKLTETLQKGIVEGKTDSEIAKDVWRRFVSDENELTEEFSKLYKRGVARRDFDAVMTKGGKLQSRATLIVRTEVARANRLFAAESMSKSNVVKNITIINCEPGCPICAPHQNVEIEFGAIGDIDNLHPNCTGTIVPGTISAD